MPIEIDYTKDETGVIFNATGKVTGKDVIKKSLEVHDHENFTRLKYWIIDRSGCTDYEISPADVKIIAAHDIQAAKMNPGLIIAIVAHTDLQYGMSRMYEAYLDGKGFTTMVFHDRESADEWVKKELEKS